MKNKFTSIILIILVSLFLGFIDLTPETKNNIFPFLEGTAINDAKVNLGLDLQGGAQLDYKIDLRKVPESDRDSIVEGVLGVINKRVNSLGVAEPNIYEASVADETHIIVELAGIHDLEKAKDTVGKTIQLEFKEQKTAAELDDPNYKGTVKTQTDQLMQKIKDGGDFAILAQEEEQAFAGKVFFDDASEEFVPLAGYDEETTNKIKALEPGTVYDQIIDSANFFHLIKVIEKQEVDKEVTNKHEVTSSHILVAYQGAERAAPEVTRTKEEAKTRAEEALQKVRAEGADFAALASEYSDGPSKDTGGKLELPVAEGGAYDPKYTEAALKLEEGQTSELVETPFGFHIIKADKVQKAGIENVKETQYKYQRILVNYQPDPWKDTGLTGEHFVRADVDFSNGVSPQVVVSFNDEGAQLFEDITGRNVDKPVAIFVGGELISSPTVQQKITGGRATITGNFTIKTAQALARDLNTGAIPAPIVLSGQYTIGSTLGQEALETSLNAGLIGLILVGIYMLLYYRLLGIMAVIALSIYSTILLFLIKIKLSLAVALLISTVLFIWLVTAVINSRERGWEKVLSLVMAVFGLFFITFLLSTSVVLTLAGVAGVILSIGMAVDANILIFERMKEELRNGRPYSSALEIGFERAWSSIRDSNFSSLITCAILFYFGTSIIQGFAFNLAAGIVVSMLTAITITRQFLNSLVGSKIIKKLALFSINPKKEERKPWRIIEHSKIWFGLSGIVLAVCIGALFTFGLKFGIDFTGGTLMELKFENKVTKEQLETAIPEIEEKLKEANGQTSNANAFIPTAFAQDSMPEIVIGEETTPATETTENNDTPTESIETSAESNETLAPADDNEKEIDFGNPIIVTSDDGYIIKLKYLSQTTHDNFKKELEAKLGKFEQTRFTTVGPTIGDTMKYRAIVALGVALFMIVFYIAFAFRKIPRQYSAWRFGGCAIVALAHDVLIATGIFAILGHYMNVEIDALFITALLTILGFSVHDTIVVFDRVRENLRTKDSKEKFSETANKALTQTMARSVNTSVSTLITLLALYILGSPSIEWFVLALIIGTIVGTYSSIFTASPVLVAWHEKASKK